jgi:hypothetical protein
VPAWLNEGLAVMNQTQPEPDFAALLAAARDSRRFLSFSALCGSFPSDAEQARLAYAQSESFARHIRSRYGSERVFKLLSAYAAGADCNGGVLLVLGVPLADLESQWLEEVIFASPVKARREALAPWVFLSGLVLAGPLFFLLIALRPRRR